MTKQLSSSDSNLEQEPLLERTGTFVVEEGVMLLQLNVEGLTKAKINVINIWRNNITQQPFYSKRHMQVTRLASIYADTNLLPILKATFIGQPFLLKMAPSGR